jgi:hypothetical protein
MLPATQVLAEGIAIAREIFGEGKTSQEESAVAFYFVSYILIVAIGLLNVVVAVLLDAFQNHVRRMHEKMEEARLLEEEKRKVHGCLDPLTKGLCTFEDEAERENLILRLAQDKKDKEARRGGLHSATKIMKEYVASPGSSHRKAVDSHAGAGAGSDDTCSRPALEHASASDARPFEEEPLRPRRLDAGNEEDEEKESPRS